MKKVIPVLVYEDIAAGHDFLVDVLGFTSGGLERTGDGDVVHGEVAHGDFTIWLHRVTGEHGMQTPKALPASHGGLTVWVDDVDAVFARVQAAAPDAAIRPPEDQDYGLRECGVRDPDGHHWWFSTPVPGGPFSG